MKKINDSNDIRLYTVLKSDEAVSEIIGELMMVGIAVAAFTIIAAFVFANPGPNYSPNVDISGWARTPSAIYLKHNGGDYIDAKNLRIMVTINSGTSRWNSSTYSSNIYALGDIIEINTTSDLSPGRSFSANDTVEVTVVYTKTGQIIARGYLNYVSSLPTASPSPTPAGNPPVLSSGNVTPLSGTTADTYTYTVNYTDADNQSPVYIYANINGINFAMSKQNPADNNYTDGCTYSYDNSSMPFGSHVYYFNASDGANPVTTVAKNGPNVSGYIYVTGFTLKNGTLSNFVNMQSASDSGLYATLAERTISNNLVLNASSVVSSNWNNAQNTYTSDNVYATATLNSRAMRLGITDPPLLSGKIANVTIRVEQNISSFNNDEFTITPYFNSGAGTSTTIMGTSTDTIISYNVTSQKTTWTWDDIRTLDVEITSNQNGSRDGTWSVDYVYIDIWYQTYDIDIQTNTTSVPSAPALRLELRYNTSGDNFYAQIWNGSAWNTRGSELNMTAWSNWSYNLTSDEYNGGNVMVRYIDKTPSGDTQGSLYLDYQRIYCAY